MSKNNVDIFELIPSHVSIWKRLDAAIKNERIPHASLFIGPPPANVLSFAYRFIAQILCQETEKPCGHCISCQRIINATHPNVIEIMPETVNGVIKIEQIRELQQIVYQKPRHGQHLMVLMHPVDKLNRAAANALLKLLEEPPAYLVFVLVANQDTTIPATIRSRCQSILFSAPQQQAKHYLAMGSHYPEDSPRHMLYQNHEALVAQIIMVLDGKNDVCSTVSSWSDYALEDMLWFFYGLTATMIAHCLRPQQDSSIQWPVQMMRAMKKDLAQPMYFFQQLDEISVFIRKSYQSISLNAALVLETILLSYLEKKNDFINLHAFTH